MPNDIRLPPVPVGAARPHADSRARHAFDIKDLGEIVYEVCHGGRAEVAVIVPLYNYAGVVLGALDSIVQQDLPVLAVVVIDDCSTDNGGEDAASFLAQHAARFTEARVVRHHRNLDVSMARNSGIAWSSEPYLFMLDADNRLRPPALSRLLDALRYSEAAFAYSQLRLFGDEDGIGGADVWEPSRLSGGNYIDAMALIRREALLAAGGYQASAVEEGWEDHDLWCRFAELGLDGVFLPELLCEYRVHASSKLRTRTLNHWAALHAEMALRHPGVFCGPGPGAKPAAEGS